MTNLKIFNEDDYEKVHNLAKAHQVGDKEAGIELLNAFSIFLDKYTLLLHIGYFDITHSSTRDFIKLFIPNKTQRNAVSSYRYNNGIGLTIAKDTVNMVKSYLKYFSREDIENEMNIIFFKMVNKYKDDKPTFHKYINKNLHFYAYKHFDKMMKDPLSMQSTSREGDITNSICLSIIQDNSFDTEFLNIDYQLDIGYLKSESKIIPLKSKSISVYDDEFLDENWINGITCNDVFRILTPIERHILIKWYIHRLTDTAIANEFGVSRCTIIKRRKLAKEKLESKIKECNLYNCII